MKIIKWDKWDDNLIKNFPNNDKNILTYTEEEYKIVAEAAREAGYKFSGEYHQNGNFGVPYFENGKPFMVTQQNWIKVMKLAWPENSSY